MQTLRSSWKTLLLWLLAAIALSTVSGIISQSLGMDNGWDTLDYHFYNPYAFLNDRLEKDYVPAQIQTYFNPLPDIPFYWMAVHLPARAVGFWMGFIQGINLLLVALIFWKITRGISPEWKVTLSTLLVVLGFVSPTYMGELGTAYNDNTTSILILIGLLLMLFIPNEWPAGRTRWLALAPAAAAGISMGASFGLKQTVAIFLIGAAAALIFVRLPWRGRLALLGAFCAGCAAGALLTSGFWWWELWTRFRNPFFPLYNHIFQSPEFSSAKLGLYGRYTPKLWELPLWPVLMAFNPSSINEVGFSDIRYLVASILGLLAGLVVLIRRRRGLPSLPLEIVYPGSLRLIGAFFFISLLAWFETYPVYRYIVVLDLLVPLLIFALVARIFRSDRARLVTITVLTIGMLAVFRPMNYGHRPYTDKYFQIGKSPLRISDESMVFLLGIDPIAYMIPNLPAGARYIRLEGTGRSPKGSNTDNRVREAVRSHKGKIFLMRAWERPDVSHSPLLLEVGVEPQPTECDVLNTYRNQQVFLCKARGIIPSP